MRVAWPFAGDSIDPRQRVAARATRRQAHSTKPQPKRLLNSLTLATLAFTVAAWDQLPPATGREVAFAGRSNAGKSSAINALTHRRRLAFVARRPGKTRTIQFYRVADDRYLVDLPGYGYARVSAAERAHWGRLLEHYLAQRLSLVGLVSIMDIRHPLTPLDEQLLDWFLPRRLPVHVLLNKSDKLSRTQAASALRAVARQLRTSARECSVQLFSSVEPEGVDEAAQVIRRWLKLDCRSNSCQQKIRTPG